MCMYFYFAYYNFYATIQKQLLTKHPPSFFFCNNSQVHWKRYMYSYIVYVQSYELAIWYFLRLNSNLCYSIVFHIFISHFVRPLSFWFSVILLTTEQKAGLFFIHSVYSQKWLHAVICNVYYMQVSSTWIWKRNKFLRQGRSAWALCAFLTKLGLKLKYIIQNFISGLQMWIHVIANQWDL